MYMLTFASIHSHKDANILHTTHMYTSAITNTHTHTPQYLHALLPHLHVSYYNSSSVCLFVCLFVPYVLRGPLMDLRQTWWVYVG